MTNHIYIEDEELILIDETLLVGFGCNIDL
jgi:hypothetical protein